MLEEGACRRWVPPWFLAFGQRVREKLAASDPWEAQRRGVLPAGCCQQVAKQWL